MENTSSLQPNTRLYYWCLVLILFLRTLARVSDLVPLLLIEAFRFLDEDGCKDLDFQYTKLWASVKQRHLGGKTR